MASLRNPNTWAPYIKIKDCSQGLCSIYCPQWCYIIYPPPPPPPPSVFADEEDSSSMFSPLVIAIIGVLGSAFLLVSYYTIITKFYKKKRLRMEPESEEMEVIEQVPTFQESWHYTANNGLDEALIKLITVCQYNRGDGLVEVTECSVCLNVFEEGDRLRLLPKCSHAFHLPCIDMWLKSHSNCPLCRANIISVTLASSQSQQPTFEPGNSGQNQSDRHFNSPDESVAVREHSEEDGGVATSNDDAVKESHIVSGIDGLLFAFDC